MPRGQREGGIRIAHDDEEDEFDRFRFPTAFHALVSWPRFAERGFGALLTRIFEAFDIDLEDEDWTPTQGPISHAAVISSKISERIAARQHARLQGGGVADAPPVVPPPPAHVPALLPFLPSFLSFSTQ
ncbi:hypothetical protein Dimus_037653 [Dionaea muscipula]